LANAICSYGYLYGYCRVCTRMPPVAAPPNTKRCSGVVVASTPPKQSHQHRGVVVKRMDGRVSTATQACRRRRRCRRAYIDKRTQKSILSNNPRAGRSGYGLPPCQPFAASQPATQPATASHAHFDVDAAPHVGAWVRVVLVNADAHVAGRAEVDRRSTGPRNNTTRSTQRSAARSATRSERQAIGQATGLAIGQAIGTPHNNNTSTGLSCV
jgi:hypothetical protein